MSDYGDYDDLDLAEEQEAREEWAKYMAWLNSPMVCPVYGEMKNKESVIIGKGILSLGDTLKRVRLANEERDRGGQR